MSVKKIAYIGVMASIALCLSYLESLLPPLPFMVPGIKLGLANFAVLITLYFFGIKEAAIVNIIRIVLAAILFGNVYSFMFSLCGAVVSLLLEAILYKKKGINELFVSVIGGLGHNLGQLLFCLIIVRHVLLLDYFVILAASGFVTGLLIGFLVKILRPRLEKAVNK